MKPISMLPNLLTLSNATCGLLAVARSIDALAYSGEDPVLFYRKMEGACFLVFLGMVFDALDGWVARLTGSFSDFGAQLDSFSDLLTFGVAPALLAKALIEHEGPLVGYLASPRLHFAAAACYSLMAMLRLARFNLETEHDAESHAYFRGLPSPAAAGTVASTLWLYLVLRRPELENIDGRPTPLGRLVSWTRGFDWPAILSWVPAYLTLLLPLLGLLMVSRMRYAHVVSLLTRERGTFLTLVAVVLVALVLFLAPVLVLFLAFNAFVLLGLMSRLRGILEERREARAGGEAQP